MKSAEEFVVVGVLMRVDESARTAATDALGQLPGVTTFSVGDSRQLGAVIEADTLAAAKDLLHDQLEATPGVLGAWPVFAHEEDGLPLVELQLASEASCNRSETT